MSTNSHLEGATLIVGEERVDDPTWDEIKRHIAAGTLFWLDVVEADPDDVEMLTSVFSLHDEVLSDTTQFGQRARVSEYEGYLFIVTYGVDEDPDDPLVELHTYMSGKNILTFRKHVFAPIDNLLTLAPRRLVGAEASVPSLLTRILSTMIGTFSKALEATDDDLEEVQEQILQDPQREQLERVLKIRRRISRLRRAVDPIRDMVGLSRFVVTDALPELGKDGGRHLRDLALDLAHVSDLLESERDRATSAMDVYMNEVNNRQNAIMKQVAVVSTVFLPLTFITGYFGQNFNWMVDNVTDTRWSWLILGISLYVIVVSSTVFAIRRRKWFSN
jgi:magnesium transporter